ncbi:hypothetical protein [Marinospirillum sp.]|uniref:hypothetical protein n=1 Tax=Marinospirillum sp. TaxID=2183934 RepID=UPI003A887A60
MKKSLWSMAGVLVLVLLCQSAYAAPQPLMGVRWSMQEAQVEGLPDQTSGSAAFILGVAAERYRIYADLSLQSWDDFSSVMMLANAEKRWPVHPRLALVAGVHGGIVDFELDGRFGAKKFQSGPAAGVQLGGLWQFDTSWQLEVGLRWTQVWAEQTGRIDEQATTYRWEEVYGSYIQLGYLF